MAISVDAQRAALLLIDLQRDCLHDDGLMAQHDLRGMDANEAAELVARCRRLAEAARDAGRPVVFVKTAFHADYADCALAPQWNERGLTAESGFLVEGRWGTEFMDGLEPHPDEHVIVKKGHSAFLHTHLDRLLHNLGIEHCVLAGGSALDPISDTARLGGALGYVVFVADDAVSQQSNRDTLRRAAEFFSTDQLVSQFNDPAPAGLQSAGPEYALIVVDIQNDFVDPTRQAWDATPDRPAKLSKGTGAPMTREARDRLVAKNVELIDAMHDRGWPVIFMKGNSVRPDGLDSALPLASRNLDARALNYGDAWGNEVVGEFRPEPRDFVIRKAGNSAFGFTKLHRLLRNLNVRRCLVTGGAVGGCLSATVCEGVGLGYEFTVVGDATYPPERWNFVGLENRAEIRMCDKVLEELEGAITVRA